MIALVDTCVWSIAFRRATRPRSGAAVELAELIRDGLAAIIGPIRQELLSGVKSDRQFQLLRDHLRAFPDINLTTEDHELAAQFSNRCRARGIHGSNTDFLLCAVATNRGHSVFTTDSDFISFAKLLPIKLHHPH